MTEGVCIAVEVEAKDKARVQNNTHHFISSSIGMLQRHIFLGCLYLAFAVAIQVLVVEGFAKRNPAAADDDDDYTACVIFLAPSPDFGWGVFAARDIKKAELVEIIPAYLPLASEGVEIQSSILYDYVHTSGCGPTDDDDDGDDDKDQLLLGYGSSYNHNDDNNIQFVEYGQTRGRVIAVQAVRDIAMGEELLARYGEEDWFTSRNIVQKKPNPGTDMVVVHAMDIPHYKSRYCSKIQAGIGSKTWNEKILPNVTIHNFWFKADQRLAPKDTGFGVARAKVALAAGDCIELSLGLLVSERIMADSTIAPILFRWTDLNSQQQRTVRTLRKNFKNQFVLHYPGLQGDRHDSFESYEDLAILPIGALGMVRRLGRNDGAANCRLNIRESMQSGSTSVGLKLVATKAIKQGEVLLLDLPPAGTPKELELLEYELKRTGQPYHVSTFASTKERDEL